MSYTRKNWTNDSAITAADLNHMEDGLANVGEQVNADQVQGMNTVLNGQKSANSTAYNEMMGKQSAMQRKYDQSFDSQTVYLYSQSGPHKSMQYYNFQRSYDSKDRFFETSASSGEVKILEDGVYMITLDMLDAVTDIQSLVVEYKEPLSSGEMWENITLIYYNPIQTTGSESFPGYGAKMYVKYLRAGSIIYQYRLWSIASTDIDFAYFKIRIIRIG